MAELLQVLLVEDNEDDAAMLLRQLRRGGYEPSIQRVQGAADLSAALASQDWNIVISDYQLPKFTGIEALEIVRKYNPDLPFILVSGTIGEETAVTALKAGANDYLMKHALVRLAPAVRKEIKQTKQRLAAREELRRAHEELEERVRQRTTALSAANAKLVEEMAERHRAEQALRDSEERLQLALYASATGIWDWNIITSRLHWDDTTHTIFGSTPDSFAATYEDFIRRVYPEDRQALEEQISRTLSANGRFESKFRITRPDGSIRFIKSAGRGSIDENGKLVRLTGVCRDITQKMQAQEELRRAKAVAEAASSAKSEFLANMSHEIRTPMSAIIGYTDLLLDPEQSSSERLNHVNIIRRNGEHLLTVINDILDISKIEAGKMTVEWIECEPRQIIADVTSLMRVRAVEKNLGFGVEYDGPIPRTIRSDPTRLRQILLNLVGNAIKFTQHGGVRIAVKLFDMSVMPMMRFEVIDTGIGITAEQLDGMFKAFEQADSSMTRRFGGTGLGLTISKRLAQFLGGDITVESDAGRGSRFVLTVQTGPLDGVPMLDAQHELAVEESLSPQTRWHLQGTVLLVEDGPDNQQLLSAYLRRAGCQVTIADNGRIGYEKALQAKAAGHAFDVILMDMQMPVLDGYGAAAALRAKGYSGPIVALTAHAMAEDRAKCLQSGCTDYLTKPVSRQTLSETVARYLRSGASDTEPIRSVTDDEDVCQLLPSFIDHLPDQVGKLLDLLRRRELEGLAQTLHQLKGTGGQYGFMTMSEIADRAEKAVRADDPLQSVVRDVDELISIIRRVEGYNHLKESPNTVASRS